MVSDKTRAPKCEVTAKLLRVLRPHAVVDWIEIDVTLASSSNFTAIQNAMKDGLRTDRTSWITPLEKGPGGAATRFLIKMQDPPALAELRRAFKHLEAKYGFVSPPKLHAIEIAVDFYSRSTDADAVRRMTLHLMQGLYGAGQDRRLARGRGETVPLTYGKKLDVEKTLYIGNKLDPVALKVYFKKTDNGQLPIPLSEFRARAEVTLTGAGLIDCVVLCGFFERIDFKGVNRLMSFRMVDGRSDEASTPIQKMIAAHHEREMVGRGTYSRAACPKTRRKYSALHRANTLLNRTVRDSMRGLTDRVNAEKRERIIA